MAGIDPPGVARAGPGDPGGAAVDVDGLVTGLGGDVAAGPAPEHPNGTSIIDHLVVSTPDIDRTVAALGELGLLERRRRPPDGDRPVPMAFFRLGEVVLEVVGRAEPGPGPAGFCGLAFTVDDLDRTAARLGDRLGAPRPALQPGRLIAILERSAGSSVPIAFLTPG